MNTTRCLRFLLLAFAALAPSLAAQVVSPLRATTTPGGRFDQTIPFGQSAVGVRQQIHDDLRGQSLLVTALGFRRALAVDSAQARTLDLALDMGPGDFDQAGTSFTLNYTSPTAIQRVVARRTVAFPDWSTTPRSYPTPFDAGLVLDSPYLHSGNRALIWELHVFGNSLAGGSNAPNYIADAFRDEPSNAASGVQVGTGCMPTGSFVESMGLLTVFGDALPAPQWRVAPAITRGPRSQFATLFIGLQETRATLPGLCGEVYVGQPIAAFGGTTDQGGTFTPSPVTLLFDARLVGLPLVTQGVVADPGRTAGAPFSLSSGRRTVVQAPPVAPLRIASLTSAVSPLASTGNFRAFDGLVVEFR